MTTEHGPFRTEQEARGTPAARKAREDTGALIRAGHTGEAASRPNLDLLVRACRQHGADPGEYGLRWLRWLAGFETDVCVVVADLIRQAHEAGYRRGSEAGRREGGR